MAQLFKAGETKIRPGVYYRYSNVGGAATPGAMDGVNAIVINASWGPVGVVTTHETATSIKNTYGSGDGVDAALQLIKAGASKVFIYRMEGTGGEKGTVTAGGGTFTAKHPGARALTVKIQAKVGSTTTKECLILDGSTQVEKVEFAVGTTELSALQAALASSNCVELSFETDGEIVAGEYALAGGANSTIVTEDYLKGFYALEPYRYNVLSTDSVDEAVALTMAAYANEAAASGKLFIGVVGAPTSVSFTDRLAKAKAYNDKHIVFFGSEFITAEGTVGGAKAINYTAGIIAATPSNQSIVRTVVSGATDITEKLTNAQYEDAINNGLLLLSIGPDGQIWYDSGINTLTTPSAEEDNGWKKIKRAKVRFELIDRIDRVVAPLVGKINCDSDGVAAVIQAGMGVITSMIAERKILAGATMIEDPEYPRTADSAWFVIQVDDIDTLEKIYLHYQFRYSQSV